MIPEAIKFDEDRSLIYDKSVVVSLAHADSARDCRRSRW